VKNVTVSLDDATYRQARLLAAQRDTSVSALVRDLLRGLDAADTAELLKRKERTLRDRIAQFRASERLPREELHDRSI
jgi:hypothetical protein